MDDEETLTMKLLAKLEDLSSENSRLRSVEAVLENKVVDQTRALEQAEEDLRESRVGMGMGMGEGDEGVAAGADGGVGNYAVESTPILLERTVPMGGGSAVGMMLGVTPSTVPATTPETPLSNSNSNRVGGEGDRDGLVAASGPHQKPWESGGIRNQIMEFGDRLEDLERENEDLKGLNAELMKAAEVKVARSERGTEQLAGVTGGLGLELDRASRAEQRVTEVQNDMRILLAHQRTLMSTFEQKAFALGKSERNLETFRAVHAAELNRMAVKVEGLMEALVQARSGIDEEKAKRFKVIEELEWYKKREDTLQRELSRKNDAIKAMRLHASKIGEQYKRSISDRRTEGDRWVLELAELKAEVAEERSARIVREGKDEERAEMKKTIDYLLGVVEKQQEMLTGEVAGSFVGVGAGVGWNGKGHSETEIEIERNREDEEIAGINEEATSALPHVQTKSEPAKYASRRFSTLPI
ncbi:hypothetical protein TrST_g4038 [Triparma strigata]|uniref:Uncharacterized protein n=1 Tax=Triparma strigata TaxID=1606541 RepID=A0A9W7BU77_9STRA|nr:hypothetical protein TrST_g4038 [Triparma strigata]